MRLFQPYPLVITKNQLFFEVLEFHCAPFKDFDTLEVWQFNNETNQRHLIQSFDQYELKSITLPAEWGFVEFVYKQKGLLANREKVDLTEPRKTFVNVQESLDEYGYLKLLVQQEMDNLKGTIEENTHHTELINRCVVDEAARFAVLSKIRTVLIKSDRVSAKKLEEYTYNIFADLYGIGVIQALDDDPEVGEIMVNAFEYPEFRCDIYYIKHHVKYKYDKSIANIQELRRIFTNCIAFENKELNAIDNAIIETNRPNKDRVEILIPDATDDWSLNIRKFGCFVPDKQSMMKSGTIDEFIDNLFEVLVKGKANIGIGGMMGTGKTTMINYLLTYTPPSERKMVIASVVETDVDRVLKGHDIIVAKVNEEKNFTFEKLLKASLRTTSDRVIIPESRGEEFKSLYEVTF